MALLAELTHAKRCVEVGVYTGYSALCVALALPIDGRLIACDTDPSNTAIAQRYWREAGVEHIIELRLGPALETLDNLIGGMDPDSLLRALEPDQMTNWNAWK